MKNLILPTIALLGTFALNTIALANPKPQFTDADTENLHIEMAFNHKTGNWGVVFGNNKDIQSVRMLALSSCVSKDLNNRFDGFPSYEQLLHYEQALQSKQSQCKRANLSYLGYSPKSVSLFRNQLANGSYDFHGAFSQGVTVPKSEFDKIFAECKAEGTNCRHIQTFNLNNIYYDLKNGREQFIY